jgi:hypothetical protein
MRITSSVDLVEALARGQRVGKLRRSLAAIADRMFTDMTTELHARLLVVGEEGLSPDGGARRLAWHALLDSTAGLPTAHESLAQLESLERHARQLVGDVADSAGQLVELADRELPDAILPEALRDELEAINAQAADPERFARSLLHLNVPSVRASMVESLEWLTRVRLQALHATVLSELAAATPDPAAATDPELNSLTGDASAHAAAVRDAAKRAAQELSQESIGPAFAASLWGALFEFEQWLTTDAATRLAAAAAAATARVTNDDPDAERWGRETAKAYDGLRHGLAFDAGVRAVLLAYAAQDARWLSAFAETSALPVGPATADLPRTSLADVGNAAEGETLEVAALVSKADFHVGAPSNRSVLSLGRSGSVRVLVPHVAVSSFGIDAGVWVQSRGQAHPTGKDGIDGPVVMTGRIRRENAASESFTDALIFSGRHSFELRPGELDLVAGRIAGDRVTLNEIGMRD